MTKAREPPLGELLAGQGRAGGGEEKAELMRDCFTGMQFPHFQVVQYSVGQKKRSCIVCGCVWWIA